MTGCSTGIARATAERLARAGHADLERARCRTLALDVTDEASMRAGAIETVPMEDARRQFETSSLLQARDGLTGGQRNPAAVADRGRQARPPRAGSASTPRYEPTRPIG